MSLALSTDIAGLVGMVRSCSLTVVATPAASPCFLSCSTCCVDSFGAAVSGAMMGSTITRPSVVTDWTFSGIVAVTEPSGLSAAVVAWSYMCVVSVRLVPVSAGAASTM